METLDLVYEIERRGLWGFLVPYIFTLLEGTRMERDKGVTETRGLSSLQWQLIMKCWKFNFRPGLHSWWGPMLFRLGGLSLWAFRLRRTNGRNFTWAMMNFCGALPERWMQRMGRLYRGRPIAVKTRTELLASIRPNYWNYLRKDTGGVPTRQEYPRWSDVEPPVGEKTDGPSVEIARSGALQRDRDLPSDPLAGVGEAAVTFLPSLRVPMVMFPFSGMACAAFIRTFMNTWSGWHSISGTFHTLSLWCGGVRVLSGTLVEINLTAEDVRGVRCTFQVAAPRIRQKQYGRSY